MRKLAPFRVRIGSVLLTLVGLGGVGFFCLLFYGSVVTPYGPAQPIPFSHRLHAGVKGIDCRFCHPFVECSSDAGIPSVKKCLFCHAYIIPEHPQIRKIHHAYDTGTPISWKKLYVANDYVLFRHAPHVRRGFSCKECHADAARMDRLPAHSFEMGFCIGCHRRNQATVACWLGCHN